MRLFDTTTHQIEQPTFLWKVWTNGPADEYDRYSDRIRILLAEDVLDDCPDRLDQRQRELVERIIEEDHV